MSSWCHRESWYALTIAILTGKTANEAFYSLTGQFIESKGRKDDDQERLKMVRELHDSGMSIREVSRQTGIQYDVIRRLLGKRR